MLKIRDLIAGNETKLNILNIPEDIELNVELQQLANLAYAQLSRIILKKSQKINKEYDQYRAFLWKKSIKHQINLDNKLDELHKKYQEDMRNLSKEYIEIVEDFKNIIIACQEKTNKIKLLNE